MHNYYRAIGFGRGYTKSILREIINKAILEYKSKADQDTKGKLIEICIQFDKNIGLVIHGEFLENGEFEVEYSFPILKARKTEFYDDITVEKNVASYSFSAACESALTNITIIFYLNNALDYVNSKMPEKISAEVGLSGLCLDGVVLMPTVTNEEYTKSYGLIKQGKNKLYEDARKGNEEAMENLTLEEMEIYTKLSKRIMNEDVLSIVDTSFMPYGIQCDKYAVIGKIIQVDECMNRITFEKIYDLTVECNDLIINIGINKDDLVGEPMVGRRFKGNIWLQGNVNFKDA